METSLQTGLDWINSELFHVLRKAGYYYINYQGKGINHKKDLKFSCCCFFKKKKLKVLCIKVYNSSLFFVSNTNKKKKKPEQDFLLHPLKKKKVAVFANCFKSQTI